MSDAALVEAELRCEPGATAVRAEATSERQRDRLIGVYIGVLAVFLAICSMGGGNAAKEATLRNIEASNTWAFFQAKNLRRQLLRVQADEFELMLANSATSEPGGRRSEAQPVPRAGQAADQRSQGPGGARRTLPEGQGARSRV
jgi:hypothetical protein